MANDKVVILQEKTFEDEVLKSAQPVLVDFWASWCGPCRMIAPLVDQLADEYYGKARVAKVDVDENPGLAAQYGVTSIPTLLVFKNGQVFDKAVGARGKQDLAALLDGALKA